MATRRWRINDLHTAELTSTLAARLNASFITNTALDRNEVDLNRISDVSRRAPWFLDLLESMLGSLLQRHQTVEVLFIHGWNVVQPKCDIGIGAQLRTLADARQRRAALTTSPEYVHSRLESLRKHCAEAGVHASYGDRYPASHPNNLLQLFRRNEAGAGRSATLAHWATSGRLEAVQLELAIPLRWHGALRDRFLDAAAQAFSTADTAFSGAVVESQPSPLCPPPITVAFYDPKAGFGLIASLGVGTGQRASGRLLVFDEEGRSALFTGEDMRSLGTVLGGPQFLQGPSGFVLQFNGSLLEVDDGALYLRLEDAFAVSRLTEAHIQLTFQPLGSDTYGRVTGALQLGRRRARIDGFAFARTPLLQRALTAAPLRLAFAAAFGPRTAIDVRCLTPESTANVEVCGSPGRPARIALKL